MSCPTAQCSLDSGSCFLGNYGLWNWTIRSAVKPGYHRRLLAFLDSLSCMECSGLMLLCTYYYLQSTTIASQTYSMIHVLHKGRVGYTNRGLQHHTASPRTWGKSQAEKNCKHAVHQIQICRCLPSPLSVWRDQKLPLAMSLPVHSFLWFRSQNKNFSKVTEKLTMAFSKSPNKTWVRKMSCLTNREENKWEPSTFFGR